MTDAELQGLAAQALNMAKRDYERGKLNCLLASYHGDGIHRMESVEKLIAEKLGEAWLDSGGAKDVGFDLLRLCVSVMPPDALVFVSAGNHFRPTEAFWQLSEEEQHAISQAGHDRHHKAAREGFFRMVDCIQAVAQNPERVCLYVQPVDEGEFDGPPEVQFWDQKDFGGRMKMYGKPDREGRST